MASPRHLRRAAIFGGSLCRIAALLWAAGSASRVEAQCETLQHTLTHPTPGMGDEFGRNAAAISGTTVLIGAWRDDLVQSNAGTAHLFNAETGAHLRMLTNPTSAVDDYFGLAVSISGGIALIGAPNDDTGATDAGSAYLFDANTGNLLRTINNPSPNAQGRFGEALAIEGDNVLIGGLNDDTGATNAGSAYLYSAATGNLLRTFNNPAPGENDQFGSTVAISGNLVLVGVNLDDSGELTNTGSAHLFNATTGDLIRSFTKPGTAAGSDRFGISLAISGDDIVIGCGNEDTGAENAGSVHHFDAATGNLLRTFNNPDAAEGDQFGNALAFSGDRVLIGSDFDDTGAVNAGSAYLYSISTGSLLKTFNNPEPAAGDLYGNAVACTETMLLIGAYGNDLPPAEAGTAYLYACPAYDGRSVGDFDSSGCTEIADFLFLLDNWLMVSSIGGEAIGIDDFLALLDNWLEGEGC